MGMPLIESFFEKQFKIDTLALSGKTTEGKASPLDCPKTASKMSD